MTKLASQKELFTLLRNLYRELRQTLNPTQTAVPSTQTWKYIVKTVREPPNSEEEISNLQTIGQTYLSYLRNTRLYLELLSKYKGKGERSIQDTATMVGFKLPNEPKTPKSENDCST